MTETEEMLKRIQDIENTHDLLVFAPYLESKGKRFCVDFGTENAAALAAELLSAESGEIV